MRNFETTEELILSKGSPVTNDIVETKGYAVKGDGGGAQWKHNGVTGQTVSRSPAQLGDALLNDASGNQWALVVSGALNIKSIGAIGDSSNDDTTAIKSAVTALGDVGGEIYLPKGIYLISDTITVNFDNIKFYGDGEGTIQGGIATLRASAATRILYSNAAPARAMFEFTSVESQVPKSGGGIEGIMLDCDDTATDGLILSSWRKGVFKNLHIYAPTSRGIHTRAFAGTLTSEPYDTQHNEFSNIEVHAKNVAGNIHQSLLMTGGEGAGGTIQGNSSFNYFTNCHFTSEASTAVRLEDTDNNYFYQCRAGGSSEFFALVLETDEGTTGNARFNQFHGCEFTGKGINAKAAQAGGLSSFDNYFFGLSGSNAAPDPTVGSGAGGSLDAVIIVDGNQEEITTVALINRAITTPDANHTITTSGFTTEGDGGKADWRFNGVTGQTPSQSPAQLGDALLNDASGNQWALDIKREINVALLGDSLSRDVVIAAFNAAKALAAPIGSEPLHPSDEQVTLYFPSGRYNKDGANLTLTIGVTGFGIRGDGNMSQLDNIELEMAGAFGCTFQNFSMRGSGGYGIKSNYDVPKVNQSRQNEFSNLYIKGKATGIIIDGSTWNRWTDVFVEESIGNGWEVIETSGEQIANCFSVQNGVTGMHITGGGELKFVNFLTMGNGLYGVYLFADDSSPTVLEHYFNNVTATRQNITRLTSITSIVNSGGNIQVTSADHKLVEGMIDIGLGGTVDYDAEETYTVLSVIDDDNVVLDATYVADRSAGNIKLRNWDFFVDCDSTNRAKINDIFVHGSNFNYTRVKAGFNIQFNNTRLKSQFYMDGDSAIVIRKGVARGRNSDSFENIPASGNTEGLIEDIFGTINGSSSPDQGQAIRKIGNTTITQTATTIELDVSGTSTTIDANGLTSSGVLETETFNVVKRSSETISGGVITALTGYVIIDTEGAAASDDLDTISGGQRGYELRIQSASGSRQPTLKDGTGNLALSGDFTLTNPRDSITLIFNDTTSEWIEYSRSDNQ